MKLKRLFGISERFVLHNEKDFDAFMNKQYFDSFKVKSNGNNEYCFQSNAQVIGSRNNTGHKPITLYLIKIKEASDSMLILKNKLRGDAVLLTSLLSGFIVFACYRQIFVDREIPFWVNLVMMPILILFFNWVVYYQESAFAKQIRTMLVNNEFIQINT